jgi:hypothetical protein
MSTLPLEEEPLPEEDEVSPPDEAVELTLVSSPPHAVSVQGMTLSKQIAREVRIDFSIRGQVRRSSWDWLHPRARKIRPFRKEPSRCRDGLEICSVPCSKGRRKEFSASERSGRAEHARAREGLDIKVFCRYAILMLLLVGRHPKGR